MKSPLRRAFLREAGAENVRGRETRKARCGGVCHERRLRRAFCRKGRLCFFCYSIYIAHIGGVLQFYKPKERAGGEKREKIGQKGGEEGRNGAEVLAIIIIRISV